MCPVSGTDPVKADAAILTFHHSRFRSKYAVQAPSQSPQYVQQMGYVRERLLNSTCLKSLSAFAALSSSGRA